MQRNFNQKGQSKREVSNNDVSLNKHLITVR